MTIHEEFLRALDFTDEEMRVQLPLWENACRLLGLTEGDVSFAAREWIPTYWDMSLRGVKKCIAVYIREIIEITRLEEYKLNGKKILYCNVPAHTACVYANKVAGGDRIHICSPDNIISTVLSAFFNKKSLLTEANNSCSNPLCSYCGVNRTKVAAQNKGIFTEPDVVWNWGLFCNEAQKTEEYIQCSGGDVRWNYVMTTMPKDYSSGIREVDDASRYKYLAQQFIDGQRKVADSTGIEVTEADVVLSMEKYLDYFNKLEVLTELVATADPQPISGNDLVLFGIPAHVCFDSGFHYFSEAIEILIDEVKERIQKGCGPLPKGAPRLACQFIPFCVPWIGKAFMDNGVNLSVDTFFAEPAVQRQYFDRDNIYTSIARQWLCNPSAVNTRDEAELICHIITRYPLDGVLYGFFSFDRWIGAMHKTLVRIVEERTKIPFYYLEGDFWSDEKYTLEDKIDLIKSIAFKVKIKHMVSESNNAKKKNTEQ